MMQIFENSYLAKASWPAYGQFGHTYTYYEFN